MPLNKIAPLVLGETEPANDDTLRQLSPPRRHSSDKQKEPPLSEIVRPSPKKKRKKSDPDVIRNGDAILSDCSDSEVVDGDAVPYSGKASMLSCVINLLNTVVGAGMLGLPGAFAGSGYIGGTVFLFLASFFSAMGLRLLTISAETVGIRENHLSSFYSVANAAVPKFTSIIDFAVALKCFGVATGYFITVGDCMVDAFEYLLPGVEERHQGGNIESFNWDDILISRHFWILLGLLFVMPISFFKTLHALRFTSSLSLILIYGLVLVIVLYANGVFDPCYGYSDSNNDTPDGHSQEVAVLEGARRFIAMVRRDVGNSTDPTGDDKEVCQGDIELIGPFDAVMKNIAIFIFSYTCHQNVFSVVNEISNRTQRRVDTVIITSICSALLVYLIVSFEGYKTYGSEVKGDILLNYPQTLPVTVMRIAIAIMIILSYPLQLDPSRRCIISLLQSCSTWVEKLERKKWERINAEIQAEMRKQNLPIDISDNGTEITQESFSDEALLGMDACQDEDQRQLLTEFTEKFIFYSVTCTFLVLSFTIAMLVSDLGIVLSVVGATCSTTVTYILPGLIYLKIHPHFHCLKIMAYLQLILGVLIVPTALYFVIAYGVKA